jgi:iron complex transport system permease protein
VTRRSLATLVALAGLLVLTALISLRVGSVAISTGEVLAALGLSGANDGTVAPQAAAVIVSIRLPRVLLGLVVGAGLGVAGAAMQGLLRNPLADPGLLGVANGAALGAVTVIVAGARFHHGLPTALAPFLLPVAAFVGAVVAMALVEWLGRVDGNPAVATLLLAGVAVSALSGALTGVFTYLANDAQLRTITFWTMGSLGGATWPTLLGALPFLALSIVGLPFTARALNAFALGEAEAGHLGFRVRRTKRIVLALAALAVGAAVAVAGVLGFVGLVVPHLLRLALGPDQRVILPGAGLLGATLLVLADDLARTLVAPAELPLGLLTAAFGTPFFLLLLLRERRGWA